MSAWESLQKSYLYLYISIQLIWPIESHRRHGKNTITTIIDGNSCLMWKTEYMQWSVDISSNWGFSLKQLWQLRKLDGTWGTQFWKHIYELQKSQHPNISNKGFMSVQLLFREFLFSWHHDWFLLLIFIYLFMSGLIFWGFLEFWMPWSFLTRLEMTLGLKIELWSLMTKSMKMNVQLIINNSALLWHSYFTDIETQAVNEEKKPV